MKVLVYKKYQWMEVQLKTDPEQLFELFYKNVREDMNPCGLRRHNGMYQWWHERFMNAFYGIQEPLDLRSWAEAPQMWLAGYREFNSQNN